MPVSRRAVNQSTNGQVGNGHVSPANLAVSAAADPYPALRPYTWHGLDLTVRGSHAVGECPFCGRAGKFSVDCATGLWRCFTCGEGTERGGGNALVFLRLLYGRMATAAGLSEGKGIPGAGVVGSAVSLAGSRASGQANDFLARVAADRRLLYPATVAAWGICQASDGVWVVPGYATDGSLYQLYRRVWIRDSNPEKSGWRLVPTPGLWTEGKGHGLHLAVADFDPRRSVLVITEGVWDGMALSEALRGEFGECSIIAVPGCTTWRDEWTELCRGKIVVLLYDSDHPRTVARKSYRAGWDGMRRVSHQISGIAAAVRIIRWGPEGYDPNRPDGWDMRDALSEGGLSLAARRRILAELTTRIEDSPAEWSTGISVIGRTQRSSTEAQDCSRWDDCLAAWDMARGGAILMRGDLADALAVMLAICASTKQGGNQLCLDVVGSPGGAKTTLCDGLLVSGHCHHLEHLTGFHSGFKKPGERDTDCSLIARINGKTLITPEFDVMKSSPRYAEIMSQQRRIFDGKSGATYKNSDVDTLYVALRTPWIRAGTPKMMLDCDQSHLGDRFLRFIIADPSNGERRDVARAALRSERVAMLEQANKDAGSIVDPKTRLAHALTGGYVDWLRAHVEEELSRVDISEEAEDHCIDLAELSADLRARPIYEDKRSHKAPEPNDCKELPTRLARQNIRLAACLAVVLNKRAVDADVLRIIRRVALDTAYGHSLNIARWLCSPHPRDTINGRTYQECGGLAEETLITWTQMSRERMARYLGFLQRIDVLEFRTVRQTSGAWALTERVLNLYLKVMRA